MACLLASCAPARLTKEELAFNPYKKGDVLVYKDSNNTVDTIIIKRVKRYGATKGGLYLLPHYHILDVRGKFTSKKHESTNPDLAKYGFSVISLRKDMENTKLQVPFHLKGDKMFYCDKAINLIDAECVTFRFEPQSYQPLVEIDYEKRFGFTRYVYSDGTVTRLVAFIRDKKNIYNVQEDEE